MFYLSSPIPPLHPQSPPKAGLKKKTKNETEENTRDEEWRVAFRLLFLHRSCLRWGFASCPEAQEAPKAIRRRGLWGGAMVGPSSGSGDVGVGGREKSSRPDVGLVKTESES